MQSSKVRSRLKAQLTKFSFELSEGLSKPLRNFVGEMLFGIQASQDVKLSNIARSLKEEIPLIKTEDRLSRNLKAKELEDHLSQRLACFGSRRVEANTVLCLDLSDVRKEYAEKMEYLDRVWDGSEGEVHAGYWLLSVTAVGVEGSEITPLYQKLFSARAKDFVSENAEILEGVDRIRTHAAGRLSRWNRKASRKGKGFQPPLAPHEHWHVDISYVNLCGTFYYLGSVLDGYSRYLVHWELRESMKEAEVEIILERAREKFPQARPRIISDNGPQFIARDFKEFIRICAMRPVRTSPFYPQSNGKIERWHQSLKGECLRPGVPGSVEEARGLLASYVDHYNRVRLPSALGYLAPLDKLEGRAEAIWAQRDQKLEEARKQRQQRRQPSWFEAHSAGLAPQPGLN